MENTTNQPNITKANLFPVVAIGASAGGIGAMNELLKHLSAHTDMAYIYVQHLNADRESQLVPIFSRATKMPVVEAADGMRIKANHLYIIPPDKDLTVIDGHIKIDARPAKPYAHMPINKFFHSLAENYKMPPIGIILSGAATDGINGLKAIKVAGGLTFAQGDTAEFQSMPQGAIADGAVDLVLSPKEIAEEIMRIAGQKETFYGALQELGEDSLNNRNEHLLSVLQLLYKSVGVDFRFYKMNTIKRRIIRRMMLHKLDHIEVYAQFLRQHTAEINLLYQDLLINVTSFFRDGEAMQYMKDHLLPELISSKTENDPIRIWIPACSTGQEAYSMAMLLVEVLGDKIANTPVQLFATDLSEMVINKARLGIYNKHDVADIEPKRLQRFFTKTEGSYRIVKSIRDMCVFATHNVTKDPPFSRIDIISCCNLLIYLDPILQKKIMSSFHYALNNNGYLVLGKSETATTATHLFTPVDKKVKIYAKKKDSSAKAMFELSFAPPEPNPGDDVFQRKPARKTSQPHQDLERTMDQLLLSKYIPASVLVNGELDILQFRGATGLFLEPAPGRASLNLLKMARTGLGFELRNIVHKAKSSGVPVKKDGLDIIYQNQPYKIAVEAVPIKSEDNEFFFLVVFEQVPMPLAATADSDGTDNERARQLERELQALREDMRAIVESQEAANEELQSANEEIVSSNEELQSINEELETSKEELESSNEELITINQELQIRNEQLAESQEYAEAVFSTIHESIIVLDNTFRVKTANQTFYKVFDLREEDIQGKQLFEIGNHEWNLPQLKDFLYHTLPKTNKCSGLEITQTFSGIGEKVLLFSACKVARKTHNEDIVLLAIEDISEHKRAQQMTEEREEWMRNMANNAPVMMWVTGIDGLNTFVNKAYLDFRGIKLEHAVGRLWTEHIHPDDMERCQKTFDINFEQKQPYSIEYRLLRHDGVYRWIMDKAKPNFRKDGQFTGFIGSCVDIHDQRLSQLELEKRVEERTRELVDTNTELERSHSELQQFAYVASHDLQEPLRKILTFVDRIEEGYAAHLNDDIKRYFSKVHDASQHMTRLLDDLLNFSRISRLNKRFINTDLNEILQNVLSDLETTVQQKGATIKVEALPVIQAIPLQIAQLFHHLLNNALKFSKPDAAPQIQVQGRMLTEEEKAAHLQLDGHLPYCEIVVKDNGIGFSSDFAEQIFGVFQRLNSKEQFSGTGIGLSVCRKIVSNHNGLIYATGKEGDGATFHVLLPVQQHV